VATAAKAEDLPAGGEAAPKKKKKGLIIIIAAVLLLAVGGGAAWFFLKPKPQEEAAPKKVVKKPEFMSIEPWFTVNLTSGGDDRYLQAGLVLEITDPKAQEAIKAKMPLLRSGILLLLSGKSAKELLTAEGKEKLASEVLELIRGKLDVAPPENGVEAVHFSVFVIQ
jgi:flagellar FliL protein